MTRITAVLAAAAVVLVAAAILIACYLGSWWIFADSTRRTGEIRRQTFEFQQGRVDGAENQLADIRSIDTQLTSPGLSADTAAGLRNQRAGIVRQACTAIHEINDPPVDLASFAAKECQ